MKGIYLYWNDVIVGDTLSGVDLKVRNQIKTLNNFGLNCSLSRYDRTETLMGKAFVCLPFSSDLTKWPKADDISHNDYIFVRRPRYLSKELIRLMIKVKEINPSVKRIIEIPTWPYEEAYNENIALRALWNKEKRPYKHISEAFDAAAIVYDPDATDSLEEYFSGLRVIRFINGIDLNSTIERLPKAYSGNLDILCLATYSKWHGVDRILRGLSIYNENNNDSRSITLHLVGDGPELEHLISISDDLNLEKQVTFYGRMKPKEFDYLYDKCCIAIASLGMHRIGLNYASTLKTREYLAKGIPFLYSGNIDVFDDEEMCYALRVPSDESAIDISSIIEFCDKIYANQNPKDIAIIMREYAKKHVSMDAVMKPVRDFILEESINEF